MKLPDPGNPHKYNCSRAHCGNYVSNIKVGTKYFYGCFITKKACNHMKEYPDGCPKKAV